MAERVEMMPLTRQTRITVGDYWLKAFRDDRASVSFPRL